MQDKIYCVKVYDIEEATDERHEKEYKALLAKKGPNYKMSFDRFKEIQRSSGKGFYYFSSEYTSFHLSEEEAIEYVLENIADINDGGVYNYAAVIGIPVGCAYFETHIDQKNDIKLFKFNREKSKYEYLSEEEPLYKPFLYDAWGFVYMGER